MNERILVTGAGGPAAIGILRSLASTDNTLFAADADAFAPGLHLMRSSRRVVLPFANEERFVDELLQHCQALEIDMLIPTVDAELIPIARNLARFQASGTRVLSPTLAALELCLDKSKLVRACEGWAPTPKTAIFNESFDASQFSGTVVVKPRAGSGSRGVSILPIEELMLRPRDASFIVQEFLPGEEYSVDVWIDRKGRSRAAVPRLRMRVDSGVAVVSRSVADPVLQNIALRIAQRSGIRGVANVQLRRDELGVPKLLEVNPRFPGTMALTIASGVDMPLLAVQDFLGVIKEEATEEEPELLAFFEVAMVRTLLDQVVPLDDLGTHLQTKAEPEVEIAPAPRVSISA